MINAPRHASPRIAARGLLTQADAEEADPRTMLDVDWKAPQDRGGPPITDYDVQYRNVSEADWTGHTFAFDGTRTHTTITGLAANTSYKVRVRAHNIEGFSPWSSPGSGATADNEEALHISPSDPTPEPTPNPTPEPTPNPTPGPTPNPTPGRLPIHAGARRPRPRLPRRPRPHGPTPGADAPAVPDAGVADSPTSHAWATPCAGAQSHAWANARCPRLRRHPIPRPPTPGLPGADTPIPRLRRPPESVDTWTSESVIAVAHQDSTITSDQDHDRIGTQLHSGAVSAFQSGST